MIECPTMGTVNQGFLENLGDVLDIKQLDWCGFGISSLKSSRTMWKILDDNCVFTGPIVFLLFEFTNANKIIEDGDDVDDTTSMRDCPFYEGFTENVVQQILEKGDDNNSVEEIISEINLNFNTYYNAKRDIDKWLVRGLKKFRDSEALLKLVTKRNHEFNLACPKISTSDDFHDPTLFNGMLTLVMHGGSNTTESNHAQFQKETVQDDAQDEIVFGTLFSQVLDAEAFGIMEKAALAAYNINSEESDEVKYGNIPYDLIVEYSMRHMETYKGEDFDKWDIGFENEYKDNDDQHNQLDEMRKKYVTKILTWDLNFVKPSLYEMLASYNRLSDAKKESFNTEEHLLHIDA
ncbi:hypothetical protein L2E82_12818 [Cichorium intybus]|uniref:Uncharacterized protein n=1 Tax=Cichorium intybus TaxID=13427 RepID=A0ACB9GI96_CICIN|nr:hypothetical protein L2E82_12818 [Cichorium intybus]